MFFAIFGQFFDFSNRPSPSHPFKDNVIRIRYFSYTQNIFYWKIYTKIFEDRWKIQTGRSQLNWRRHILVPNQIFHKFLILIIFLIIKWFKTTKQSRAENSLNCKLFEKTFSNSIEMDPFQRFGFCNNFRYYLFEGLIECIKFAQNALMKQFQTLDHQNTVDLDPAMGKLIDLLQAWVVYSGVALRANKSQILTRLLFKNYGP